MKIKNSVRVTETIHGELSQEGLLKGVTTLHDPVASTLGASGRTVIIEDQFGNPKPTKDGVTVARNIVPFDSVERMGCEIIKQASLNTATEAGDGTTTSTILAKAIIEGGMNAMQDKSVNYTDFNRGMQLAVDFICKELDDSAVQVDLDNIESVATISANNDNELGRTITEAFKKAGEHGVVLMEKSQTAETFVSITEGFELEKGYKSEVFITDKETNRVEYRDALVLISNTKIERLDQIEPFAEYAITNRLPLVVVAETEDAVLAALAMNKMNGVLSSVVVEPSHFGVRRRDILNDLAVATGGVMIDEQTGDNFDTIDWEVLGKCRKVTVDKKKTVFFNDVTEEVQEHVNSLTTLLENEKSDREKEYIRERIAKISSAVAVVFVGASSSAEQSEKADRVDDAIHATKAALAEGIVAGGGIALHNIPRFSKLPKIEEGAVKAGFDCVMKAITEPLKVILKNGDVEYDSVSFTAKNVGLDIKSRKVGDMIEMEIIDPVRVTKTALKNAVSAASTLLSTTTTIVNLRRADV